MAVAGLSAGGTCATILALRNPKIFSTFASYSGYASPTYENDNAQQTISQLYGGSKANYEAHNPVNLLTHNRYTGVAGWFTAGQSDPQPLANAQQLAELAKRTGMQVCSSSPPGDHSFAFWAAAFRTLPPVAVVAARSDATTEGCPGSLRAARPLILRKVGATVR